MQLTNEQLEREEGIISGSLYYFITEMFLRLVDRWVYKRSGELIIDILQYFQEVFHTYYMAIRFLFPQVWRPHSIDVRWPVFDLRVDVIWHGYFYFADKLYQQWTSRSYFGK